MQQDTPIMRTIRNEAKATGLPEHLLRSLVKQGKVRVIYAGTRAYVNHSSVCSYLNGEEER